MSPRPWRALYSRCLKRALDVAFAALLLAATAPLMAAVAVYVRMALGAPVLFVQARPGLKGRPFRLLKFRTMSRAVDSAGEAAPDALRLTPAGRFLRTSSLDELPEIWNVLTGDMSFVGPRPLLMEYLPLYTPEQARRHEIRPGITGWAQVNGRNAISWEEKFRRDVWYVDNQSFTLDLCILWRTVLNVIRPRGVSQPGHVTMERFRGSRQ